MSGLLAERPRAGRIPSRRVRRLMQALTRSELALRRSFARILARRFAELGRQAAAAYLASGVKAAQPEPPTGDDMIRVTQIMLALNAREWAQTVLRREYVNHYARVITLTGETIEAVLGLGVMIPDPVERAIIEQGGRRVGLVDLDTQTRRALYKALAEARANGDGPAATARRISHHVAAGRYQTVSTRAILIARTETKYAQNVSSVAAYRSADGITGCIAYDNRGNGNSDIDCVARDGEFFTFEDADAETQNEHPNGTLSWGPATGG